MKSENRDSLNSPMAPAHTNGTCDYLYLAFSTLLVYDHAITFYLEVERIWTLKWRLPKVLFLINRYITPALLLTLDLVGAIYPLTSSYCRFFACFYIWVSAATILTTELVLAIRVSALYGHSRIILYSLTGLFVGQGITVIILTINVEKYLQSIISSKLVHHCIMKLSGIFSGYWIPFVVFDTIIIILTLYKVFSYHDDMNPTVKLLAQDSIIYFIVMLFVFLFNVLALAGKLNENFLAAIPAECLGCIAVARMMMNIRGLAFDDPFGSQGTNLSNIQFQIPPDIVQSCANRAEINA